MVKEIDLKVQEAQRVPIKLDPNRTTPRPFVVKMPKIEDKQRILQVARKKKKVIYKGVPIRLSADFSRETLQVRRGWQEVFKV